MVKQNLFTTEQLQNFIVPQFQSKLLNLLIMFMLNSMYSYSDRMMSPIKHTSNNGLLTARDAEYVNLRAFF